MNTDHIPYSQIRCSLFPIPVLMQSASGGNPLFPCCIAVSHALREWGKPPRPRCIASIFPTPHTPHPIPCLVFSLVVTPSGHDPVI
ncbi:MAG: hypothetical protein F6K50_10895 [Moorea sp. SIO3I7]|uniref:hypothetical protein n=1 Tax=Moorena sp. SIO3I6 TaxID=2607831 RepID=UPI0013CB2869|nr:hypothetical protein [Moorena sp. SIO3I6]NEN96014.1 hypothetical protein [Moorena sp. SIO3I7]NEP24132.1 hypothetical protein [Moorena sp. SIO3I6]